jgi:hypothetical protein
VRSFCEIECFCYLRDEFEATFAVVALVFVGVSVMFDMLDDDISLISVALGPSSVDITLVLN